MSEGRVATTLVMLAIFSAMSALALGFPEKAAFTPLLIGIPGAVLCLAQLAIDLAGRAVPGGPAEEGGLAGHDDAITRREWFMFAWLAAFTIAIVGFGFHIGGTLAVVFYIRLGEREGWLNALAAGAGTFLVIWLMFTKLLELPLFPGLLLPAIF